METNRDYFSYSQYSLWKSSPKAFYKKYTIGSENKGSKAQWFGKEFMRKLEFNEDVGLSKLSMEKLDILAEVETKIQVETTEGVKLYGIIDSFELKVGNEYTACFQEYKTGKIPWNQSLVDSDEQTDFYAYMIYRKYNVIPTCNLIWVESSDAQGKISLTGKVKLFPKTWELSDIKKIGKKITKAYIDILEYEYEEYVVDAKLDLELCKLVIEHKVLTDKISAIKEEILAEMSIAKNKYGIGDCASYTVANRTNFKHTDDLKRLEKSYKDNITKFKKNEIAEGLAEKSESAYLIYKLIK